MLADQNVDRFHQARLVRIAHGRLAIWLDPLGVLVPQVVVKLFPQVCARIKLVKHDTDLFDSRRCHDRRVSD